MALSRNLKVGAFVLSGLVIVCVLIFVIGQERNMFTEKVPYQTVFRDVEGLRRGSTVRMGGLDVGSVTQVAYSENPKDDRIYVTIEIVENEAKRVRVDSLATIEGKGLLGDKMIVVSVGSPSSPPLAPGGRLKSEPPQDFTKALENVGAITAKAEQVLENLNRTTGAFADPAFTEDVKSGVDSLAGLLRSMDKGEGYVGRLMRDPQEAQRISALISNLERSSARLDQTLASVNSVVQRVQSGPGLLHDVVYEDGPTKAIEQFGGAADELRMTLKGIREGNGLARGVLYGDEQSGEMVANINQMTGDLRQIVADVRAGKGTIGALLVDPSVYEDLKLLLGNVERNKTLRALVRYSITRDEKAPSVEVRDPSPPAAKPSGATSVADSVPVGKSRGSAGENDAFTTP